MNFFKVGCAVIKKEGRILIAQRLSESFLGGCWEFPGGKLEEGESFEDCVVREVREELDFHIEVRQFLHHAEHTYPEKTVALYFYLCDWVQGEPQRIQCQDFRWVQPEELRQYTFPKGDEEMIEYLIENQEKYFNR